MRLSWAGLLVGLLALAARADEPKLPAVPATSLNTTLATQAPGAAAGTSTGAVNLVQALAGTSTPASTATAKAAPPAPPKPLAAGLGRITGRITVEGVAPKLAALPVTRDIKQCGTNKADDSLETGPNNGVKNVAVWLADGPKLSEDQAPAVKLDLAACMFTPHVAIAAPGSVLTITNKDPVFHDIRASGVAEFNYPMPVQGYSVPTKLTLAGILKLRCNANPWISAVVHVVPTTAVVLTEADGSYVLDVPPGRYHFKLWHERLGEREATIEVIAGETTYKDFALAPNLLPRVGQGLGERPSGPPQDDLTMGGGFGRR